MFQRHCSARPDLDDIAKRSGFNFHIIGGEPYWVDHRYYQFTLEQIERDLEVPTLELHQMCLSLVDKIIGNEQLLTKIGIPQELWDWIAESHRRGDPSLYGRLDFSYNGKGHAKLLEYNAQTPTSLYEAAYFQWNWLSDQVERGVIPRGADQFNKIQEALIIQLSKMRTSNSLEASLPLLFSSARENDEDRGTVDYLRDCALQAGWECSHIALEDIGIGVQQGNFGPDTILTDLNDQRIAQIFMLYPFEHLFNDGVNGYLKNIQNTKFIEPPWKILLSNKGILPLLWKEFKGHPNLLPAYFSGEEQNDLGNHYVTKPIFSREGENVTMFRDSRAIAASGGDYGDQSTVTQQSCPLPQFGGFHTMIGSWIVGDEAVGLTIREDFTSITKDTALFTPHIIL